MDKLLTYSIIKPHEEHIDEYIEDIKKQYETGITIMPLFMLFFTPEGDNSIDKVTPQCEVYKKYKERLDELGIPSGVLVQSTIGHGGQLIQTDTFFQFYFVSCNAGPPGHINDMGFNLEAG